MSVILPALGSAFAAAAVWGIVRLINRQQKPGAAFWAAVALVAVGSGYLASYFAMANTPKIVLITGYGPWPKSAYYTVPWNRKLDQVFWRAAFAPAHWIDRQIRPDKWVYKTAPFHQVSR